jgi:hypothetical protein
MPDPYLLDHTIGAGATLAARIHKYQPDRIRDTLAAVADKGCPEGQWFRDHNPGLEVILQHRWITGKLANAGRTRRLKARARPPPRASPTNTRPTAQDMADMAAL